METKTYRDHANSMAKIRYRISLCAINSCDTDKFIVTAENYPKIVAVKKDGVIEYRNVFPPTHFTEAVADKLIETGIYDVVKDCDGKCVKYTVPEYYALRKELLEKELKEVSILEKEIKFKADLCWETSYGSTPIGTSDCEMALYVDLDTNEGHIVWDYENDEEADEIVIGLWFDGNKVTGYDGVFSLPSQAIELLKDCGFNTEEVE